MRHKGKLKRHIDGFTSNFNQLVVRHSKTMKQCESEDILVQIRV